MRALSDSPRLSGRRSIPRSTRGVSLVELMVVVTIISMLMALAVPSYQRVQKRARAGALVNDFRVFSTVYLAYAHENGVWPPETAAGVLPAGITSQDMKTSVWTSPTPIGGHFDWEYNQIHQGVQYRAAIAITDTADAPLIVDLELYQMMDEALDDGNLSTGSFRLGENNCPLFVLEQ
jgi:prepilin-type N-terminal cleavage/methylation domain-containing protein